MKPDKKSFVHIYYGSGKGKTTASMGLCMRAAGHGKRVLIYQFLKGNTTSEIASLAHLPTVTRLSGLDHVKFSFQMNPEELQNTKKAYQTQFQFLSQFAQDYDLRRNSL